MVGGWRNEEHLVVLYQSAYGLLYRRGRQALGIFHGLQSDIDDFPLSSFLSVVNPSDDGHDAVHVALVIHAVFAMEVRSF